MCSFLPFSYLVRTYVCSLLCCLYVLSLCVQLVVLSLCTYVCNMYMCRRASVRTYIHLLQWWSCIRRWNDAQLPFKLPVPHVLQSLYVYANTNYRTFWSCVLISCQLMQLQTYIRTYVSTCCPPVCDVCNYFLQETVQWRCSMWPTPQSHSCKPLRMRSMSWCKPFHVCVSVGQCLCPPRPHLPGSVCTAHHSLASLWTTGP